MSKRIRYRAHDPRAVGPGRPIGWLWVLCIQYFVVQIVCASAWRSSYSWRDNVISDLGNTACGSYHGRLVCSPWHPLMNVSFMVLGVQMIIGAALLLSFGDRRGRAGLLSLVVSGVGTLLVGLFPENSIAGMHFLGAGLVFVVGNIGILLLALTFVPPGGMRSYTLASALVALASLPLFATNNYLGLGAGGMERLTAYPQTIWLIGYGIHLLKYSGRPDSVVTRNRN
jgi:hypothetical membrane protein